MKNIANNIVERLRKKEPVKILDEYVLTAPSDQNILDIFDGQWSSQLPNDLNLMTQPGSSELFNDDRVVWAEEVFGSFENWNILELGPLEAGHSYMFQNSSPNKVIAVEANTRAFLKCLCIKEILQLDKVEFKLGDFIKFLEDSESKYDMVFASGVLYHMKQPIELIKLMSEVTDKIFLWTHYYDENVISKTHSAAYKFSELHSFDYDGVSYDQVVYAYKEALNWEGFCGGPQPTSRWLTRESIMRALNHYGFNKVAVNFDKADHQNGPSFAICAQK